MLFISRKIKTWQTQKKGAVNDQRCQKWSGKFCARYFLLNNLGRAVEIDSNQIK